MNLLDWLLLFAGGERLAEDFRSNGLANVNTQQNFFLNRFELKSDAWREVHPPSSFRAYSKVFSYGHGEFQKISYVRIHMRIQKSVFTITHLM